MSGYDALVKAMYKFKEYIKEDVCGGDDTIVESTINTGLCYGIAYYLKALGNDKGLVVDIVRSYSHWFIRVEHEGDWWYMDAWAPEGTTDLLDITDNAPELLEVWSMDDTRLLNIGTVDNVYSVMKTFEQNNFALEDV